MGGAGRLEAEGENERTKGVACRLVCWRYVEHSSNSVNLKSRIRQNFCWNKCKLFGCKCRETWPKNDCVDPQT